MTLREFIRANRDEIDAAINGAMNQHTCECGHCRGDHSGTFPYGFCRCGRCRGFQQAKGTKTFNDEERREWILNDEGLYNWARSEGVRI